MSLNSIKIDTLISNPQPSPDYQESVKRIQELQKNDPTGLAPTGRSILMDHGRKVKKVIVFFHGFTSSPRQFKDLGKKFFQLGYNVYIPRIPHHGMNDQMRSHLDELTAEKLVKTNDEAVDIARGLGNQVTVAGLSMGGVMAAWIAQFRSDVDLSVIIAPNFGTYRIPNFLLKQTINLLHIIPDHLIWWDAKQKSGLKRPTGTYQGFSSRAMAEIRRLGWGVQAFGKNLKPKAKSMLVITNGNDDAVKNENIGLIINNWIAHNYQVQTYEFPKELKLGHDLIDPEQPNQNVSLVYPKIIELIEAKETDKQDYVKSGYVLTSDKMKIHYDHYINNHEKAIVLAHGFYNSKEAVLFKDMAKALNDEYDVIVMDFRGHGKSDGPFDWTVSEYQDLEAILGYAHERYKDVGVIGFSLGAASSIITAAKSDLIKSLIVVSAPTEFNKIDKQFWKMEVMENIFYNVFEEGRVGKGIYPGNLWLEKTKPIDVVADIKIPVFFVHGAKDWLILPWHSEQLFEKAQGKKKLEIVEDGTHAEYIYRRDREGTIKMFKEWFKATM